MTETFAFPVITETAGDAEYKGIVSAKFGDGYVQEAAFGINNKVQNWRVTFTGDEDECQEIVDFLDEHGGTVSFFWTPPLGTQGYYKCKKYGVAMPNAPRFRLSMEFEQHFAP